MHPRHEAHAHLLKLHGGVDGVARTLRAAADGRLSVADTDTALKRSFLVATSDLTHWRDSSQWVQDATSDALRSRCTVFIGVSGADPVTFRATRARIAEWERFGTDPPQHSRAHGTSPTPQGPALAAIDRCPEPRLYGMTAVRRRAGVDYPVVKKDAGRALRGTYAWWIVSHLLDALDEQESVERRIHDCLSMRLCRELSRDAPPTPLIDVLCDSLGPGARWAAVAESRPPLHERAHRPESRWRYASWFAPLPGYPTASRNNLKEIAACAVALSGCDIDGITDPWSGVVHLPDDYPGSQLLAGTDILPLPWPWRAERGLESEALQAAIGDRFLWDSGRGRTHLASPRLLVIPVGTPPGIPNEMTVAGTRKRVAFIDWFCEILKEPMQ